MGWYIYTLNDPRTDAVRYVGMTHDPVARLASHLRDVGRRRRRDHKTAWLRSLAALGLRPVLHVVEEGSGDWQAAERRWIAHFRSIGADLTNGTAGGDGLIDPTPDVRARISAALTGRTADPAAVAKRAAAMKGRKPAPQTIEAARFAHLGKTPPRGAIERMAAAKRGSKHTDETREKMRRAHLGKKYRLMSDEGRANVRAAAQARALRQRAAKEAA